MEKQRNEIDNIDSAIADLLDKRISICKRLAKEKGTIFDLKRESEILNRLSERKYRNISGQHIRILFGTIFIIVKEEMRNV